ncbi:hypothetical protein Tco_1524109 [Tanacetum coccineum]
MCLNHQVSKILSILEKVYKVVKALYGLHQAQSMETSYLAMQKANHVGCHILLQKQNMLAAASLLWASFSGFKIKLYHIERQQHIAIRHHFIRDAYEKKLIQSKNSLVKHFEDMRLCRPSKEYLQVSKTYKNPSFKVATLTQAISLTVIHLYKLISLTDDLSLLSNMAALESCPKHNMIAYLEKTEGNVEFHEVIDFLRRSYIYQRMHLAIPVSISEASIRTDLIFDDADGIDSLPNQAIFNAIQRMGYEGDLMMSYEQQLTLSPNDLHQTFTTDFTQPSPTPIVPDSIPEPTGEHLGDHSSNDTSLSGNEDDITLLNVYDLCISLCKQQRLSRKSSSKKQRMHKKSVSKQGRKIAKGESSVQRDPLFDIMPEDNIDHVLKSKEKMMKRSLKVLKRQREGGWGKDTEEKVESTDGQTESTEDQTKEKVATQDSQTSTQTPTSMIFGDDETIATLLLNMSQSKDLLLRKKRKVIDPKDKGKKKIEEEDESESEDDDIPQAVKKFKQLESDEELARKIQEEWEAEEERNRIAEEKATNEALIKNFDDIKARIEADRILAEKLQEQEREQFTIEERAKFLHDTIAAQRKFLAQQRSEAIRNRPPTKNQLRNQMMTYLKHVGNFKHSELKSKKFEDIQAMYEKIKRSDEDFIVIGSVEDESLIKE